MFKGCQKKIILLKNTGSGIFDEAYFIISEKAEKSHALTESDMINEANRIISDNMISLYCSRERGQPRGRLRSMLNTLKWFAAGAGACGAFIGIISLFA